ncbi:ABC transporter ATP-binding protein [Vreelandella aquamarina]|uniref:ABC transporter ATP-binding protein n=1 Tax=Vreelandella aquamarina TaxID=77097 RepID=UPI00384E1BB8
MLEAHGLSFYAPSGAPLLEDISLRLAPGEWLGLSGDSGAGKSTLGKLLAGQLTPCQGSVRVDGLPLPPRGLRPVQWLPQSPELAVNPRWRVGKILKEAWTPPDALMKAFGIEPGWLKRFPSALSGGELQRVCVLRALAPSVRYVVADEISTMLDPITQLRLWQALKAHAERHHLGVIVISHDLALLNRLCHQQRYLEDGRLSAASAPLEAP